MSNVINFEGCDRCRSTIKAAQATGAVLRSKNSKKSDALCKEASRHLQKIKKGTKPTTVKSSQTIQFKKP
jgi:hypothetical protein